MALSKMTIMDKPGYQFSYGSSGKKWIRGRTMYSTGVQYISNSDYIECIVVTNLDSRETRIATAAEAKRFIKPEFYETYCDENMWELRKRSFI